MTSLFDPLTLPRGPAMRNRFMLAPLTNLQSHAGGIMSAEESQFLVARAQGGFAMIMTCAAYVQPSGQGFPGQLGAWSDACIPALEAVARRIAVFGSLSCMQLQHSGWRAKPELTGETPRAPWDDAMVGARRLATAEIDVLVEDFVRAALRAQRAGFDGIELHAAHGYILAQFLDAARNERTDGYGGAFAQRTRILWTIIERLREQTRPDFQIGVRLSPERYGMPLSEVRTLAEQLMLSGQIDYLDMSLWDSFKAPEEPGWGGRRLIDLFTELPRGATRVGVAGKIGSGTYAQDCLNAGADFVLLGRAAILHHDFPQRVAKQQTFAATIPPVTYAYLEGEAVGPVFADYLGRTWKDFIAS